MLSTGDALGPLQDGGGPMIETMPLAEAPEAYARIMRGDTRFRMVLTMA